MLKKIGIPFANKNKKNNNYGCTEAISPFTSTYKRFLTRTLSGQFVWHLHAIVANLIYPAHTLNIIATRMNLPTAQI